MLNMYISFLLLFFCLRWFTLWHFQSNKRYNDVQITTGRLIDVSSELWQMWTSLPKFTKLFHHYIPDETCYLHYEKFPPHLECCYTTLWTLKIYKMLTI